MGAYQKGSAYCEDGAIKIKSLQRGLTVIKSLRLNNWKRRKSKFYIEAHIAFSWGLALKNPSKSFLTGLPFCSVSVSVSKHVDSRLMIILALYSGEVVVKGLLHSQCDAFVTLCARYFVCHANVTLAPVYVLTMTVKETVTNTSI